jgi:hypothetical protein
MLLHCTEQQHIDQILQLSCLNVGWFFKKRSEEWLFSKSKKDISDGTIIKFSYNMNQMLFVIRQSASVFPNAVACPLLPLHEAWFLQFCE